MSLPRFLEAALILMPRCLVSLGSNLGDRHAAFDRAVEALTALADPGTFAISTRHETVPVGGPRDQSVFVNAAVSFQTRTPPSELLEALQEIEHSLERQRHERWAARTIDLDLLLYGEETIRTPRLRVPHPRMTFRPFVLRPACEIAGDWEHPECGCPLRDILSQLETSEAGIGFLGDEDQEIRRMLIDEKISVSDARGGDYRLLIDARPAPWPLEPSGPRLVLADCPREHWREEVLAAVECVWPTES